MAEQHPVVIALSGDWDIYRREELQAALQPASECADVVLDLSAVTYADSTVLSVLAIMRKQRVARGFPPLSVVPSASITRLFEITQMSRLWRCFPSVDDALRSFAAAHKPNSA